MHQQYIGKKTQVVFLLLKTKELLLELNTLKFVSVFTRNIDNAIFVPKYGTSSVMPVDMCNKPF